MDMKGRDMQQHTHPPTHPPTHPLIPSHLMRVRSVRTESSCNPPSALPNENTMKKETQAICPNVLLPTTASRATCGSAGLCWLGLCSVHCIALHCMAWLHAWRNLAHAYCMGGRLAGHAGWEIWARAWRTRCYRVTCEIVIRIRNTYVPYVQYVQYDLSSDLRWVARASSEMVTGPLDPLSSNLPSPKSPPSASGQAFRGWGGPGRSKVDVGLFSRGVGVLQSRGGSGTSTLVRVRIIHVTTWLVFWLVTENKREKKRVVRAPVNFFSSSR